MQKTINITSGRSSRVGNAIVDLPTCYRTLANSPSGTIADTDTFTYDDASRMLTSTYNNGVAETRAYNTDNTLASISYTGAAIGNFKIGWNENKIQISEGITGTMHAEDTYGYGFACRFKRL